MPKFYFHIASSSDFIEDFEGMELPGKQEAVEEANNAAREMLAERIRKGEVVDGYRFEVHDESGTMLFALPFREVLRLD